MTKTLSESDRIVNTTKYLNHKGRYAKAEIQMELWEETEARGLWKKQHVNWLHSGIGLAWPGLLGWGLSSTYSSRWAGGSPLPTHYNWAVVSGEQYTDRITIKENDTWRRSGEEKGLHKICKVFCPKQKRWQRGLHGRMLWIDQMSLYNTNCSWKNNPVIWVWQNTTNIVGSKE